MPTSINELLSQHTMRAADELTEQLDNGTLRCLACGHRCRIAPGKEGVCRVRFNQDGELRAPAGYVAGLAIDPIEKKPFYHAFPGRDALSFGMLGCDFHCSYCQNWISSQVLRDDQAIAKPNIADAEHLADLAVQHQIPVMVSTYNEPLITADWAIEIFKLVREHGVVCGFVSNGNATPEVLRFIRPYVDLYKIDLKCFDDKHYRKLGGTLERVTETIRMTHDMGFWVEVVTLIVPDFNDSDEELKAMADFIASVSADIPWHVTAFHPDYKMSDPKATPARTLIRACDIGRTAGLKFVYPGNIAGSIGDRESTFCPECNEILIRRSGFYIKEKRMEDGQCSKCGAHIPGVWEAEPPTRADSFRMPRPIRY